MLCWCHPRPSNMDGRGLLVPDAPFQAPLTVVWDHRGLGQWLFRCFQMNAAVSKACWNKAYFVGGMIPATSGHVWTWPFLLHSLTVSHSSWCTSVQSNARDAASDVSQCWGWMGFVWDGDESVHDLRECTPCIPWCLSSYTKHCQHDGTTRGRGGSPANVQGLAIARCDDFGCLCMFSPIRIQSNVLEGRFLADRTYGRAIATVLRPSSSSSSSSSVTLCIVAKRCVLEQKLLLTAYRKSPSWICSNRK